MAREENGSGSVGAGSVGDGASDVTTDRAEAGTSRDSDPDDALQRLAELRARFEDVRERLERARYEGSSDDERITASVDSTGHLVGLDIDPRVFRSPDSQGLAAAIVLAVERAASLATEGSNEIVRDVLGDGMDPDALLGRRGAEGTARPDRDHLQLIHGAGSQPWPGPGSGPDFGGWAA